VTLWILDTDCFSLFQEGHPRVRKRVYEVAREDIAVTIVTVEEQMYGRLNQPIDWYQPTESYGVPWKTSKV
jgi:tRNA(fMet)-specific endonuclease VapC